MCENRKDEGYHNLRLFYGGERGIRTPGPLARSTVFKTAAFDRSAISPGAKVTSFFNLQNPL